MDPFYAIFGENSGDSDFKHEFRIIHYQGICYNKDSSNANCKGGDINLMRKQTKVPNAISDQLFKGEEVHVWEMSSFFDRQVQTEVEHALNIQNFTLTFDLKQ